MNPGSYYTLLVKKRTEHGVYLCETDTDDMKKQVLLPKSQVPEDLSLGDKIRVFIYRDSSDRLIATVNEPKITVGGLEVLKVKEVAKIGAFLDWGLEKDLFLPYRQMLGHVDADDEVLVTCYIDKSGRLCASMKHLYDVLSTNAPYKKGDTVSGRVYEFGHDFGTFVAVDDKYSAMIPKTEDVSFLKISDIITARVTGVKADGKLDLSLREEAYKEIDSDSAKVMKVIEEFGGVLPFSDKASPEVIMREMHMSKAAFKRAVGHLYKDRLVEIKENCIRKL